MSIKFDSHDLVSGLSSSRALASCGDRRSLTSRLRVLLPQMNFSEVDCEQCPKQNQAIFGD